MWNILDSPSSLSFYIALEHHWIEPNAAYDGYHIFDNFINHLF